MNLADEIKAMAMLERGEVANPFMRRQFGQWAYKRMQQRETLYQAVIDIYEGNVGPYIEGKPSNKGQVDPDAMGRFEIPVLMAIMNKWNNLYVKGVKRVVLFKGKRLPPEDKANTLLQEIYKVSQVDSVFETQDTLMRLTGTTAVRPWFDAVNDEMVFHLYSANNLRIVPNNFNPARPRAVALVGSYDKEESDGGAVKVHQAEYFTDKEAGTIDGSTVKSDKLGTRNMPLVFGFDKKPINKGGFFVGCPGPGLAAIDRILANDFTSEFGLITLMQGFGVPVTWGMKKGQKFKVGPDQTIDFPGEADKKEDFDFRNPNAPLEDIGNVIQRIIDWVCWAWDIPKTMLDASMSPSGVAQVEANAPLGKDRDKRISVFRPIETRMVQVLIDVLVEARKLPAGTNPADYSVAVFYPEPQITKTTTDQIAQDNFNLDKRITTPAAIYMRENPGEFDTEKEAADYLALKNGEATLGENGAIVPVTDSVQSQALNGVQVTALQGILLAVSQKDLPAEAAGILIKNAYPSIQPDDVSKMVKSAASNPVEKEQKNVIQNTNVPGTSGGGQPKPGTTQAPDTGKPAE